MFMQLLIMSVVVIFVLVAVGQVIYSATTKGSKK